MHLFGFCGVGRGGDLFRVNVFVQIFPEARGGGVDRGEFTVPCPALLYSLSLSLLSLNSKYFHPNSIHSPFFGVGFWPPEKKGKGNGEEDRNTPLPGVIFYIKKNFFFRGEGEGSACWGEGVGNGEEMEKETKESGVKSYRFPPPG